MYRYLERSVCPFLLGLASIIGCGGSSGNGDGQNDPPTIESQPGTSYPIDKTSVLNLDASSSEQELTLDVVVSDFDVEQQLEFRVFLDSPPPPETVLPSQQGVIPATGSVERPYELTVPYEALVPGKCHKIELVVVGKFGSSVDPRQPVEPGDIAEAFWWIEVVDDENPVVVEECQYLVHVDEG